MIFIYSQSVNNWFSFFFLFFLEILIYLLIIIFSIFQSNYFATYPIIFFTNLTIWIISVLFLAISCLRNRTTLCFVYGLFANLVFFQILVTNQQKYLFPLIFLCLRFIFACRLVLYLYACAVENPKISGFCVSKSKDLRTDHHKWVKNFET